MSNSGKVKCTCGWSWNKSDSSKKDMYICHECGRDNSNNMKNGGWLNDIEKSQNGKKVLPETEADRAKKVARQVAGATGIGMVLDQFPGVETTYDVYNVIDAYRQGDPMKILPNMLGALIPGTAGKAFEAITDEYLPNTPEKEKQKMKAVLKGKRATPKQMKKAQESVDWSGGFKKLYDDVSSLFEEPSLIDKEKVIKYFNNNRKVQLENGGWLDNYADGGTMQEHQENYNNSEVSLPEGFVGMGNNTKGRDYSPAWGGQFQMGGNIYPVNYVPQAQMGGSLPGASGHFYARYEEGGKVPGDVGFDYPRTINPAPDNGPYAKKTMASAQNGKEMKYYQEGLDFKPKSISKNGGWLDGYDVAQNGYNFDKINIREVPEIVRDNTRVVFRDEKGKQREVNPNKQITTTKTKYNKAEKEKALVAERRAKLANSMAAQNENYTSDNWRELLARETQATGDKFRLFPEEDSFIDNWLNPGVMIGNMASNLGQAPYQAEQTDSYMPYVTAIGTPLTVGALAGYGANSNSQFVNNLVNPLAGINPLTGLKNTVKKIPYGETAIPFAWKSRANELGQIESQAMFDAIKQSEKLTEADKVLLAEYQFDSAPFTGTGFGSSPEKRAALQKIIDKVNPEFQSNTVLTRRINADNASLFNNENGIIQIGDRPTSFSAGLGADANFGKDRYVLSGQNAKAVEANFLKNPYEELAPETIDDLQNFTDITHPGFTGKPESYTNYKGEVMTNMPLTDNAGFVNELNQTAVEKELIGSGFDFKQLGKVKNDLGGYDYIVKPTNIKQPFKSEIDWGNWNKEIPENTQLMNEYKAIEQQTKADGRWMKNPDGSSFQGTPEQFVQQNSENFKKYVENAKGNYNDVLEKPFSYHGSSNNNITEFHTPQDSDYIKATADTPEAGIFLTNEKSLADIYATKNKNGKAYELYAPANYARPALRNPNNIIETSIGTNIEKPILTGNLDLKDVEYLKSLNYTGIADHYLPNSSLEKVVFDKNIIKSAVGNNGMFDITNPDIYKSVLPIGLGLGAASQLDQKREGGIIKDDRGQWDHPGEITRISGSNITMKKDPRTGKALTEPLLGISNRGERKRMYPGQDYQFEEGTEYVTEFPMAKNGMRQEQKGLVNLDQLTNFTNYNKPQPGGWLNKYN